jgi:hypothetical protein
VFSGAWGSWPYTEVQAVKYDEWRDRYADVIAIRGGKTIAFDLDISEHEDADAVRDVIEQIAGSTVVRRRTGGSRPHSFLMYRVDDQMTKRRLTWRKPGASDKDALEFLGKGQYWNLVGAHTRRATRTSWIGPYLSRASSRQSPTSKSTAIFEGVGKWATARGYEIVSASGSGTSKDRAKANQESLLARDWPTLRELIDSVEEQDLDYHEWAEGVIPAVLGASRSRASRGR